MQYDDLSPEEITQEVGAGRLLTAEQARDRVLAWGSRFYAALTQLPPDAPKPAVSCHFPSSAHSLA